MHWAFKFLPIWSFTLLSFPERYSWLTFGTFPPQLHLGHKLGQSLNEKKLAQCPRYVPCPHHLSNFLPAAVSMLDFDFLISALARNLFPMSTSGWLTVWKLWKWWRWRLRYLSFQWLTAWLGRCVRSVGPQPSKKKECLVYDKSCVVLLPLTFSADLPQLLTEINWSLRWFA